MPKRPREPTRIPETRARKRARLAEGKAQEFNHIFQPPGDVTTGSCPPQCEPGSSSRAPNTIKNRKGAKTPRITNERVTESTSGSRPVEEENEPDESAQDQASIPRRTRGRGAPSARRVSPLQEFIDSLKEQAVREDAPAHWFGFNPGQPCQWPHKYLNGGLPHVLAWLGLGLECPQCHLRIQNGRIDSLLRHLRTQHKSATAGRRQLGEKDLSRFVVKVNPQITGDSSDDDSDDESGYPTYGAY
ncbi:hypothetical protein SISNIDRAFT_482985 [Sistotremastrum niveocremeum HHB9708]|uniref:Uncharacterized protein n=1 Tax=Sistotremastrum niveocremeum HHB9708 TaxID=1314777 RepID=A0A164XYV5_9AGAM|nr:hypothetical protein SISNIDRAFT_482985 [Sistotremastrum niveocremeum HHB9708]